MATKPPAPIQLCMVVDEWGPCARPVHTPILGIRMCPQHENRLLRRLKKRDSDRRIRSIAEREAGESPAPRPMYPGWGETSGGLPTLGKDR